MVEITKLEEGFLKHKFDPKQQLDDMDDTTTVCTGNTEEALILGIKLSSVITISMHEVDGGRGKCVLREVLKQSPGVRFYYKVGDEFRHCSVYYSLLEERIARIGHSGNS